MGESVKSAGCTENEKALRSEIEGSSVRRRPTGGKVLEGDDRTGAYSILVMGEPID